MKTKLKIISCLMMLCLCFSMFAFTGCTTSNAEEYIEVTVGETKFNVNPNYTLADRDELLSGYSFKIHTKEGRIYTYYDATASEMKSVEGGSGVEIILSYDAAVKSGLSIGNFSVTSKGEREMSFTIFGNISVEYGGKKCKVTYTVEGHEFRDDGEDGLCDVDCDGSKCGRRENATSIHN